VDYHNDIDLLYANGQTTENILKWGTDSGKLRMTLFTGSSRVAEHLVHVTNGRIKLEDAGFDWKIMGLDGSNFTDKEIRFAAHVCDQDAFAASGQKCSSQSILFAHKSWIDRNLIKYFEEFSKRRNVEDLTIGPVLTWTNERIQKHLDEVLSIPKSKLIFGGKKIEGK